MAPILSLSCLGTPLAVSETGEPVRFRTRKHLALLIRLAVEPGKRFTRDYLTELLWPGASARLANHSLAQGLSVIRSKVGREHVLVQRATVALAEGAVDVDVFHVENADGDIRGGFLEGFELPAARPFEDWTSEWRARLSPRLRDVLVRRMDASRRIGDFAAVERFAGALHDLEPLCEDAIRGMIEARAWVGDRTSALKVYSAYVARLAEELGAKPSPDLERMADLLREGRRSGPKAASVAEPAGRAERRFEAEVLIGREREFSVLYDAWLAARRRNPAIVVLTGDAGLGKTTLTNAFVSNCQLEGAVVARAQAYDAERELPFAILAELVRQLAMQRAIGSADPEALSELSRLTPEVCSQFPGVPKPTEWAAEIVPLRLADAFLKTVAAAAEESPVVLVVDDLHAADNASAAILHVVARKLPATRLLMILAARSAELRTSGTPGALATDLLIPSLRPIELDPLPDAAAARLVTAVRIAALANDSELPLERILTAGRGNPLALELLTREWLSHGPESLLRDLEAVDTQPSAHLGVPRTIKAVFDRQVSRLDPRTKRVLDLAAVLGRRLADLSLYRAVECTPTDAANLLSVLRDEGLVREVRGSIEFRNELIRAQAYYSVPAAGRAHLHCSVGELLDQNDPGEEWTSQLETAWHFMRGGNSFRASRLVLEGARKALSYGAPYEAERALKGLLSQTTADTPKDFVITLATALLAQSKAAEAEPLLDRVIALDGLTAAETAEIRRLLAAVEYLLNRDKGTRYLEAAEAAVRAARQAGNSELIARALYEFARSGTELGQEERVEQALVELNRITTSNHSPDVAPLYYAKAYCYFFLQEVAEAKKAIVRAVQLAIECGNKVEMSFAYSGLGICDVYLCQFSDARSALREALRLSDLVGDDSRASLIAANLCTLAIFTGQRTDAIAFGVQAVNRGSPNQPHLITAFCNLAEAHVLNGEIPIAHQIMAQAREWIKPRHSWWTQFDYLLGSIFLALVTGDLPLALRLIEEAEANAAGRLRAVPNPGMFHAYRVLKAVHTQGDDALELAHEGVERFRNRNVLYFLDALAAMAYASRMISGQVPDVIQWELGAFDILGAIGKKDLLKIQGFLE